jgi:hypothetical protein
MLRRCIQVWYAQGTVVCLWLPLMHRWAAIRSPLDPLAPVEGLNGARREQHLNLGTGEAMQDPVVVSIDRVYSV